MAPGAGSSELRARVPSNGAPAEVRAPVARARREVDLLRGVLADVADRRGRRWRGRTRTATGCAGRRTKISSRPGAPTNGLSAGPCTAAARGRGSMRRILPSSESRFWAFRALVAAPAAVAGADVEGRRGRNASWPPLWLASGSADASGRAARRSASARSALARRGTRRRAVAVAGRCSRRRSGRVLRVVGRERDRQQALLAAAGDAAADVEERASPQPAPVAHDPDRPACSTTKSRRESPGGAVT